MKLNQEHINQIKTAFKKMQNKEDLLSIMNFVKPLVYGDNFVPFDLKQLTYYANHNIRGKVYKEFQIQKKSGGYRTIHAPVNGLKSLQKCLAFILQCVFEPHSAATGFVKNKSIVDNAKVHVGNHYVYNIDLKDFFQSIDQARVWKCLQLHPFKLTDLNKNKVLDQSKLNTGVRILITNQNEKIYYTISNGKVSCIPMGDYASFEKRIIKSSNIKEKFVSEYWLLQRFSRSSSVHAKINKAVYSELDKYVNSEENIKQLTTLLKYNRLDIAGLIANICCAKMDVERKNSKGDWCNVKKNVLPQGAPTSPVLTNVVCQRLDYLFTAVAKRFGLKYSRYADDITFSSLHNVFQDKSPFLNEVQRIITDQGFTLKDSKTRLQVDGMRKSVTGLVVNEKVNVPKSYVKQIRMWLYYWERYGYKKAETIFTSNYLKDKGHTKEEAPSLLNVLDGKLNYLKMVKGPDDSTYQKLKERFDFLAEKSSKIEPILKEWEKNGIESAMKIYENL